MAVVKYSALVDQLRGNLNGTVLSKFHGGFNSYKKGQPKRWGSEEQQIQRQSLSVASKHWKNASQLFRDRYSAKASHYPVRNRFGELVFLPPFQYYMLISRLRQMAGLAINTVPGAENPPINSYEVLPSSNLTITATDTGYVLSGLINFNTLSSYPNTGGISIYVSSAVSSTDVTHRRTHYFVRRLTRPGGFSIGTQFTYQVPDTLLPSGFRPVSGEQIEVKLVFWISGQAGVIPPVFFRVPFTYVPPAPPVWEINWAYPNNDARFTELRIIEGTWKASGTASWYAGTNELLPGVATDYNVQVAVSPNKFFSDIPRPEEFDVPRPTYSGVMVNKVNSSPFYFTPLLPADFQTFLNANFSYSGMDEYMYQPVAVRIQRPSDGVWSNWGYSNIWLPIF